MVLQARWAILSICLLLLPGLPAQKITYPPIPEEQRAEIKKTIDDATAELLKESTLNASFSDPATAAGAGRKLALVGDLLNGVGAFTTLTGWTTPSTISLPWQLYTGTIGPISGVPLPRPITAPAVVADMNAPSSLILFTDFVVPARILSATLSFQYYYRNFAGTRVVPNPLTTLTLPSVAAEFALVDMLPVTAGSTGFEVPSSGEFM
jgi:hypothetical protein